MSFLAIVSIIIVGLILLISIGQVVRFGLKKRAADAAVKDIREREKKIRGAIKQ